MSGEKSVAGNGWRISPRSARFMADIGAVSKIIIVENIRIIFV